jgi:hypothetical protein
VTFSFYKARQPPQHQNMPEASPELTGIRAIKHYVVAYKSAAKINFIHQQLVLARLIPHQIFNHFKYLHHRMDDGCEIVMMMMMMMMISVNCDLAVCLLVILLCCWILFL